jgi:hypothetical protein
MYRAPLVCNAFSVDFPVGITDAGGKVNGKPIDRDSVGANSPNPYVIVTSDIGLARA